MFSAFVQRANTEQSEVRRETRSERDIPVDDGEVGDVTSPRWTDTVELLLEEDGANDLDAKLVVEDDEDEAEAVPLTRRRSSRPAPADVEAETRMFHARELVERLRADPAAALSTDTVVEALRGARGPSPSTQRLEAAKLVPRVDEVPRPEAPPHERSEDGLAPSGELDRILTDMAVLLRYGHEAQVRRCLDALRTKYPQDLILTRRFAEFYVANARPDLAVEQLFTLASALFERRNVEGMRQALEQVLRIDANNDRARRLMTLLEQRPPAER
jgi:hypothetical protein